MPNSGPREVQGLAIVIYASTSEYRLWVPKIRSGVIQANQRMMDTDPQWWLVTRSTHPASNGMDIKFRLESHLEVSTGQDDIDE